MLFMSSCCRMRQIYGTAYCIGTLIIIKDHDITLYFVVMFLLNMDIHYDAPQLDWFTMFMQNRTGFRISEM